MRELRAGLIVSLDDLLPARVLEAAREVEFE